MKRKIIGILICMIFILSANTGISYSFEQIQTKFDGPTVVINSPEDGAILNNPQIVVEGYASGMGIKRIDYAILYAGGGMYGSSFDIDPPTEYYEFSIDFEIVEGSDGNTITVTAVDVEDNEGSDSIIVFYESGEDDTEPPIVTITYPSDGYEFSEPDIYVMAEGFDNVGIMGFGIIHEWEGGFEDTGLIEVSDPSEFITINESITLREGWNSLEVYMEDLSSNQGYDDIEIFWVFFGLHIESIFQPVQVVYQHDPLYPPDDLIGGPCDYTARLGMVAGKNTYLFGHPYGDREQIKMTCCNNYLYDVTFQYVLKIYPDNKEIWRSDNITVRAGEIKISVFNAPLQCPRNRFQWDRWSDNTRTKPGRIELTIEPDHTGGISPCDCYKVVVDVILHKTHDLKVLFVPFTFGDGPAFPADLANIASATAFDTWRWNTLEPWWNAIYPLREEGLTTNRNWLGNLQKNLTTRATGEVVSDLASFQALDDSEVTDIWNQLFEGAAALGWMRQGVPGGYDRIIWMVHPDILAHPVWGRGAGWAYQCPPGTVKQGVLIDWNARYHVSAHEVGHTYGLPDNYAVDAAGNLNRGDHAVGYWVNENRDVLPDAWDLMAAVWEIWGAERTWIKKPNFIELLERFTNQRDPEVLGISGYIDKNDNVELNPWYKLDQGFVDLEWETTGDYSIKTYDNNGLLLNEAGFNVSFKITMDYLEEIPIEESLFNYRVEWNDDIERVDIVNSSSNDVIATRTISSNSPELSITSPSAGDQIKQGTYEISWVGSDDDGDTLIYAIFISNDSGINWFILDFANTEMTFNADFSNLPKGDYQIKVMATDGINVGEDTTNFGIKAKIRNNQLEHLFENFTRLSKDDMQFLKILKLFPYFFIFIQQFLKL